MSCRATIVISTRNRPDQIGIAISSVLRDLPADCNVIVVDQSDDGRTRETVQAKAGDSLSVSYAASDRRGLSAARNDGSREAVGDLLLFTDDDCVVEPGWCEAWIREFGMDPRAGVGFGRVTHPPFDSSAGLIPSFDIQDQASSAGLEIFTSGSVGMGANMAVRRSLWESLGGFDEGLGSGSAYGGADDLDFAYRAARLGWRIIRAVEPTVTHHGFRPQVEASGLYRDYAAGTAAMYAKHIRCGDFYAANLLAGGIALMLWRAIFGLLTGRRPLGLHSLYGQLIGAASSLRRPVDRARRVYRPT
jgi:GT2 family glycosyltransferase